MYNGVNIAYPPIIMMIAFYASLLYKAKLELHYRHNLILNMYKYTTWMVIMRYQKICAHCGEPFETNNPQKIYCDRDHYRPCPVCGEPVKMIDNDFSRAPKCCSTACAHRLRQTKFKPRNCVFCGKPFIPKSGVQLVCDDIHYATCEICGKQFVRTISNQHVTTCSPECTQAKLRIHSLEKYGTEYPMQCSEVQQHFHETMKAKYGVEHALQVAQFQEKAKATNLDKFGVEYGCLADPCVSASTTLISNANRKFQHLLELKGVAAVTEKRLNRFSYDLHVPQLKLLIEINPSYTHSTAPNHWGAYKSMYYHRDKTQLAEDNGYRCIHVWDWDDWGKVVDLIAPKTALSSEDMSIYRLTPEVTNQFLEENDIHRTCRGQLVSFGLVKDEQVYQVMTFGKPKYDHSYNVQMMRMCTKRGFEITDGFDRLSHFASADYGLSRIIAYCDRSKYTGQEHEQLGMKLARVTPPQLVWSKDKKKITANLLRVHGYDQLFGTTHESDQSDDQLMLSNGWLPVYDCGQRVYVFD